MSFGTALQVAAVKLVNALCGDGAVFLPGQGGGDFLPGFALLALLADELHKRFEPAVKSASAAGTFAFGRLNIVDDFLIHQRQV